MGDGDRNDIDDADSFIVLFALDTENRLAAVDETMSHGEIDIVSFIFCFWFVARERVFFLESFPYVYTYRGLLKSRYPSGWTKSLLPLSLSRRRYESFNACLCGFAVDSVVNPFVEFYRC